MRLQRNSCMIAARRFWNTHTPKGRSVEEVTTMTEQVKCGVCGKSTLKTAAPPVLHLSQTYYVCGQGCRERFIRNPGRYAKPTKAPSSPTPSSATPTSGTG